MPSIALNLPNGKYWTITHCELVIPVGSSESMSSGELAGWIAFGESLSQRFSKFLQATDFSKDYFASVEEFELFELTPGMAKAEQSSRRKKIATRGFVYLAHGGGHYKIGRSSNFSVREHHLTLKLPFPVEIIHLINATDAKEVEQFWHAHFSHKRTRGEWFSLTDEDVRDFKQHLEM
jgi:hypothetical protein